MSSYEIFCQTLSNCAVRSLDRCDLKTVWSDSSSSRKDALLGEWCSDTADQASVRQAWGLFLIICLLFKTAFSPFSLSMFLTISLVFFFAHFISLVSYYLFGFYIVFSCFLLSTFLETSLVFILLSRVWQHLLLLALWTDLYFTTALSLPLMKVEGYQTIKSSQKLICGIL